MKESEIIDKINSIINDINKDSEFNIEFLGFYKNYSGTIKDTKIILKDKDFDQIEVVRLRHLFEKKRWICQKRTNIKIGKSQIKLAENEAVSIIETKIKEINNLKENIDSNRSLKFLGFKDGWIGTNNSILKILCKKHNELLYLRFSKFIRKENYGCKLCMKERIKEKNGFTPKEAEENIINKFNNTDLNYDFSHIHETYNKASDFVRVDCPIHGPFQILYTSLVRSAGNTISCPKCNSSILYTSKVSKGESKCKDIIESLSLNYKFQYIIDEKIDSKIANRLYVISDFYIPSLNTIIEYNGKQHYEYTPIFHSDLNKFVDQVNRDLLLRQYCKNNGIKLLEIPYLDDNRLEEVIEDFLLKGIDTTTPCHPKLPLIKI